MTARPPHRFLLTTALTATALLIGGSLARPADAEVRSPAIASIDRRIVDVVEVGNLENEQRHGFAGDSTIAGATAGKPWRRTFSWMHYALKTFEDTPVTLSLTLIADGQSSAGYDVIVEDSVVASRTFAPDVRSESVSVVDIAVPFDVTKGKAHIAVIVRARGGATPSMHSMRTIQDHFEEQ